jgi:hypothetical protein
MPRRDGLVFLFGTAIFQTPISPNIPAIGLTDRNSHRPFPENLPGLYMREGGLTSPRENFSSAHAASKAWDRRLDNDMRRK